MSFTTNAPFYMIGYNQYEQLYGPKYKLSTLKPEYIKNEELRAELMPYFLFVQTFCPTERSRLLLFYSICIGFQVLTAVDMKSTTFWM
jgi:nitric oxide reductase large subunit